MKHRGLLTICPRCCLRHAPDVVPDMPQMISLSIADIKDCLQMALALEPLITGLHVLIEPQLCSEAIQKLPLDGAVIGTF